MTNVNASAEARLVALVIFNYRSAQLTFDCLSRADTIL